jgi:hypothetical protein
MSSATWSLRTPGVGLGVQCLGVSAAGLRAHPPLGRRLACGILLPWGCMSGMLAHGVLPEYDKLACAALRYSKDTLAQLSCWPTA